MATVNLDSPELIARAKELVDTGAAKATIEVELGLNEQQTTKLLAKLRAEQVMADDPEIISRSISLINEGKTKAEIGEELDLSAVTAEYVLASAWSQLVDDELKLDDAAFEERTAKRKEREEKNKRNLHLVSRLMAEGMGRIRIQRESGLTKAQVERLMNEIRNESFLNSKLVSKQDKADKVNHIKSTGGGAFQVARALDIAPGNAVRLTRKVAGKSVIADDTLRFAMAKGTTLFHLINRFGIANIEEVREVFQELFPEHLLFEKPLGEGNIGFTVIPDGSGHLEWMNANTQEKDFRYKISEENNYLFIQFEDVNIPKIRIYNFTDVHVGHRHFARERFLSYIKLVQDDPCAFVVLGGDIIEWAHKMSVGDPWEQVLSPMEQVMEAARLLMPIAHKILAYRSGNHDKGRGKLTGTDLAEVLATYLKVPYFKVETVIDIDFRGQLFTVSLDHGHSGGAISSILRDAEKYREYSPFFVHAHFSGHVHNSQIIKRISKDRIIGQGYAMRRTYTIIGGSCVDFTGTYAEEAKYAPTPQDLTYFEGFVDGNYDAGCIAADPV